MGEHKGADICARRIMENLGLRVHEGDRDAMRYRVDETRECVMREGEATSHVASGIIVKHWKSSPRSADVSMVNGQKHTIQCMRRTPL